MDHRRKPFKSHILAVILASGSAASCGSQQPSFTQTTVRSQPVIEPATGTESDRMGRPPAADATVETGDYRTQDSPAQQLASSGDRNSTSTDGVIQPPSSGESDDVSHPPIDLPVIPPSESTNETPVASSPSDNPPPEAPSEVIVEAPTNSGTVQNTGTPTESITEETVATMCQSAQRKTKTITLSFNEKPAGCAWNQDGNLDPIDGIIRARHEEMISLNLEETETICDLAIKSDAQSISFDDSLLLTFNDVVLMSSYDYTPEFASQDGLFTYSWPHLVNAYNPGPFDDNTTYCLGSGEGDGAHCEVPETQSLGTFALTLPKDRSHQLSALAKTQNKAELALIVTGDDNSDDCQRSALNLQVEISYVGGGN